MRSKEQEIVKFIYSFLHKLGTQRKTNELDNSLTNVEVARIWHKLCWHLFFRPEKIGLTDEILYSGWHQFFKHSKINEMTYLIKGCYFTDLFPAWYFYFLGFLLFLFFLFLLSFLLLEFNAEIGKLQLDHIVHHLLDLVLNLRKNSLFYLL